MIERITDFWIRNRLLIVTLLSFFLMMNLCGRIFLPPMAHEPVESEVPASASEETGEEAVRSYEEIMAERAAREKEQRHSVLSTMFWIIALTLAGFYLYRRGWLAGLMPQWISFKSVLLEQRSNGRLLMRISIVNNSRKSETFNNPRLVFKNWGKSRIFVIKKDLFPLTLTPGTSHTILIDLQNFYEKVPGLKKFGRIGAEIETSLGKVYRTRTHPRWLIMKRV